MRELLISSPFWKEKLSRIVHPSAVRMAHDLDPAGPLGIGAANDSFWKGFKHAYGEKDSTVDFLFRVKKQHPEKIVLVQVGEFYETWGIDSIFLVEYCGLNRMGKHGPRAGAPLANIQAVLDGLTQAGFSIVVCEQTNDITKTGRKTRFVSEIITPSSPVYTYGLAMDKTRGNALFPDCPPEFGIACDARGMIIVEVNPDLRTLWTYEGLTQEAASTRLTRYGGRLGRIFCHENTDKEFLERCGIQYERVIKVSGYLPKDFSNRVEELIKIDLSLDIEAPFMRLRPLENKPAQAPRPIYQRTANQIGILPERGVPDLIEHMLPSGSPMASQNLIRNFLLNPPPKQTADQLRFTLHSILSTGAFFSEFPISNPARYVKTLIKREAGPDILKDLHKLAQNFLSCYQMDFARALPPALSVISHILSTKISETALKTSARMIVETLEPVLPAENDAPHTPDHESISHYLFETVEDEFRGRVAKTAHPEIAKLYTAVERAAARYEEAVQEDFIGAMESNSALSISYDVHNKTIWMKGPLNSKESKNFIRPNDRYGKPVKDRWSTTNVEHALEDYKDKAEKARQGVAQLLGQICQKLASHHPAIVHLATFSNFMRTLILHVKECQSKGWSLEANFAKRAGKSLLVQNFFPYWMNPHEAVKNTLRFDGILLLTGHNMSGKSTLIRSMATTTLLAASGWMFPAEAIEGGEEIDGWFVRTGAHDDPLSGLSAFAVEMTDVKTALRDATEHSLIFIDELGKGTESKAGHAIAASVLEQLNGRQIKGIFATHWHELFFNPKIDLEGIAQYSMQVRQGSPAYKLIGESSLTSSAFDTALKLGLDKKVIDRAVEIAEGYTMRFGSDYLAESAAPYPVRKRFSIENARLALSETAGIPEPAIHSVAPEAYPLFKNMNTSCLYVLRTKQGFFYVGETDNLIARIHAHRNSPEKREAEFIYAAVTDGKSRARKLQARLIIRLKSLGFPMLSIDDSKQRHFNDLQTV